MSMNVSMRMDMNGNNNISIASNGLDGGVGEGFIRVTLPPPSEYSLHLRWVGFKAVV